MNPLVWLFVLLLALPVLSYFTDWMDKMSRSGYSEDYDYDNEWQLICWRGAVASAIRGKRGQAFLREMLAAMDALPEKKLIADKLESEGDVCAIGSVGRASI